MKDVFDGPLWEVRSQFLKLYSRYFLMYFWFIFLFCQCDHFFWILVILGFMKCRFKKLDQSLIKSVCPEFTVVQSVNVNHHFFLHPSSTLMRFSTALLKDTASESFPFCLQDWGFLMKDQNTSSKGNGIPLSVLFYEWQSFVGFTTYGYTSLHRGIM